MNQVIHEDFKASKKAAKKADISNKFEPDWVDIIVTTVAVTVIATGLFLWLWKVL